MDPRTTIERFDRYLDSLDLHLEAVVIGGVALVLLGIVSRQTRDCDVLDPRLPPDIAEAAKAFAATVRARGEDLADDWLNNGPESLADYCRRVGRTDSKPSSAVRL